MRPVEWSYIWLTLLLDSWGGSPEGGTGPTGVAAAIIISTRPMLTGFAKDSYSPGVAGL
ncbi:hypothetical protein KAU11_11690 [Candidatus Babeliales bacterium]|nr:hypothetical protein [Candidatus Babeliales bacterium]